MLFRKLNPSKKFFIRSQTSNVPVPSEEERHKELFRIKWNPQDMILRTPFRNSIIRHYNYFN